MIRINPGLSGKPDPTQDRGYALRDAVNRYWDNVKAEQSQSCEASWCPPERREVLDTDTLYSLLWKMSGLIGDMSHAMNFGATSDFYNALDRFNELCDALDKDTVGPRNVSYINDVVGRIRDAVDTYFRELAISERVEEAKIRFHAANEKLEQIEREIATRMHTKG